MSRNGDSSARHSCADTSPIVPVVVAPILRTARHVYIARSSRDKGSKRHRIVFNPADAPDPELVYANYLKTCAMLGIEPTPRERALGLIEEWTEVLSGRPESTEH